MISLKFKTQIILLTIVTMFLSGFIITGIIGCSDGGGDSVVLNPPVSSSSSSSSSSSFSSSSSSSLPLSGELLGTWVYREEYETKQGATGEMVMQVEFTRTSVHYNQWFEEPGYLSDNHIEWISQDGSQGQFAGESGATPWVGYVFMGPVLRREIDSGDDGVDEWYETEEELQNAGQWFDFIECDSGLGWRPANPDPLDPTNNPPWELQVSPARL